jgi:hypothetical protein
VAGGRPGRVPEEVGRVGEGPRLPIAVVRSAIRVETRHVLPSSPFSRGIGRPAGRPGQPLEPDRPRRASEIREQFEPGTTRRQLLPTGWLAVRWCPVSSSYAGCDTRRPEGSPSHFGRCLRLDRRLAATHKRPTKGTAGTPQARSYGRTRPRGVAVHRPMGATIGTA